MRQVFQFLVSLVLLVSLVGLSSCKKDGQVVATFTATMEDCADVHNAKTILNDNALQWVEGDEIKIHSGNTAVFTATPLSPATKATFTTTDPNFDDAGSYIAYYPAEINGALNQITLPTTQESEDGSLRGFPMHAYADGSTNLRFHNLCGVLKLNLQKTGVTVTSISLTMNEAINGTYNVNNVMSTEAIATLAESPIDGTGSNTTTLVCNQSINEAHDFYLYLPAGTYTGLILKIATSDGMVCTKGPATGNVSIVRSKYSTLMLGGNDLEFRPIGSKGGLFSVSATQQVWFSQGNLQYQAGFNTWRFAENQYDYVGSANSNISSTYSGWIDLFGWGTSGWNSGAVCYQPWSTSTSDFDYYPGGSYTNGLTGAYAEADWAYHNAISNGGNAVHLWRTLTSAEWDYLLNTRVNASSKYGTGNINGVHGVHGMIILPDSWTLPSGCTFNAGFPSSSNWTHNSYTLVQWAAMEAAGAVFLPAAGSRLGTNVYYDVGRYGLYWSSTPISEDNAYRMEFCSSAFYAGVSIGRYRGISLRPVRDNN